MFPHEAQEMMAKILFVVFAMLILSFSKVNASQVPYPSQNVVHIN